MPTVYLIRGVSGSGKTTFAKTLASALDCHRVEADMYFMIDGEYKFNPEWIGSAHAWCYKQFCQCLYDNENVIVSNTFTQTKDMQKYIDTAQEYGYSVVSLVVENRHGNKDVHGVPEATLERQESLLRNNLKLR